MRGIAVYGVSLVAVASLLGGCVLTEGPSSPILAIDEAAWMEQGLQRHWDYPLKLRGGQQVKSLRLDGPVVLVETTGKRLHVINADDGFPVGTIDLGRQEEPIYGISRYLDRLYVVGLDGFREHDLKRKGALLRRQPLLFPASTRAIRVGDEIFVGSESGKLHALLQGNLAEAWSYPARSGITSGPTVVKGVVAIGAADGEVLLLKSRRTKVWSYRCHGRISSELVTLGSRLFVACEDTKLYCLTADTGQLEWHRYLEAPLKESPVPIALNNLVYQYSPRVGMSAMQIEQDGAIAWQKKHLRRFAAATASRTYFVNDDGDVEAVAPASGESLFVLKTPRIFAVTENHEDSAIFLTTRDGHVYCMRDKLGQYIDRSRLYTASAP